MQKKSLFFFAFPSESTFNDVKGTNKLRIKLIKTIILLCLRTQCVDLGQEQWVFIHLFCKKYCVVQKIVVPLHRQKVNRLF